MVLYVATSNAGKLRDFAHAAGGIASATDTFRIEPLPHLATIPAPPEDESTFEGNARAKALYYAAFALDAGSYVLADDSGLEVDWLDGAPGVRSARYAEDGGVPHLPGASLDERNNATLLQALAGVPAAQRHARYRCVLALAGRRTPDSAVEVVATAAGTLEGVILEAPRGTAGFGYDPLFLVAEHNRTMAELDPAQRLALSHRGRALRSLLQRCAIF